ncbi:MAG: DUF424 family protein [Acidilobaceae archaeon]
MREGSARFHLKMYTLPLGELMASIVDEDALGLVERDEEKGLIIDVNESFYKGEIVEESEALRVIEEAEVIILVGKRAVRLGVESGYVHEDTILKVGSLEYAQIVKVRFQE